MGLRTLCVAYVACVALGCGAASDISGTHLLPTETANLNPDVPPIEGTPGGPLPTDPCPTDAVYCDPFGTGGFDSSMWRFLIVGSSVSVQHNPASERMMMDIASAASGAFGVSQTSQCTVSGDFDIQVDYELVAWPSVNGVRIGLAATNLGAVERVSGGGADPFGEVYLTHFDNVGGIQDTTDLGGTLRIVREANTSSGYYRAGNDWILVTTDTETTTAPESILFSIWSSDQFFSQADVSVAFDNFIINAGALECP